MFNYAEIPSNYAEFPFNYAEIPSKSIFLRIYSCVSLINTHFYISLQSNKNTNL